MPYANHQCQKCGAPIGYLGRFMERWFAWAVGKHTCKSSTMPTPPKKPKKVKRYVVHSNGISRYCKLDMDYDAKGVCIPTETKWDDPGVHQFGTKDGAVNAIARTRAAITDAQKSQFPQWDKFNALYSATELEVTEILIDAPADEKAAEVPHE